MKDEISKTATVAGIIIRDERQKGIFQWCCDAFGFEHAHSIEQRGLRLLEETLEACQAAGVKPDMAHKLIDYVYSRPVGSLESEIGGVSTTLLAFASAANVSADTVELQEFKRVLSKPLDHFRRRNAIKGEAGFNVVPTIEAGEEVHSCDVSTHNDPPDCSGTLLDTGSAADKTIERLRSLAPKDLPDPIQYLAELNKEADS